jgi:hypothetical protein
LIVSPEYRYLFIEIPMTGSWAIRHELTAYYAGVPVLHKHASYPEFRKIATGDEESYFVFATVRNPLDLAVSSYYKLKTDHKGAFSDPEMIRSGQADYADKRKYDFIKSSNASFEQFFRRYYRRIYNDMIDLSSKHLDFVIRYEGLQEGFAHVLSRLHITQVRPVPIVNKTQGRTAAWEAYYTPDIREQAKKVFGPFMKKWGYEFPASWGPYQTSWLQSLDFYLQSKLRNGYRHYFRYSDRRYARLIRLFRARLLG